MIMAATTSEPIAIIGSACRFAGDATSPSKLWELLRELGTCAERSPMSDSVPRAFTTSTMRITQRLLMETVYEGLEDAGLTLGGLRGSNTSVYVGVMTNDYEDLLLRELQSAPTYLATGIGRRILSNRVSYFFDWHGPSTTMDTACSSSLVAVHMVVQTLRSGESRLSVACGSNLLLGPENFIVESKLKMLSPDGRSKMWDHDANGYARGDGVAAVILKTLNQAIAGRDSIDCIIRETSLNQDGATTGITMPSSVAQKALILSTYEKAGLDIQAEVDRPQYFEAHGTGELALSHMPSSKATTDLLWLALNTKAAHSSHLSFFSALSEQSLRMVLSEYSAFLESNHNADAQNLAHTLRHRRSAFPCRVSLTASSTEDLRSKIADALNDECSPLGNFTGRGAQYARMGAKLLEKSTMARRIIQERESYLAPLPKRPTWSLQAELLASANTSRVGEAAISQSLCTAVQIMVLDLVREANVNLDAAVGHSSGEIAAAYASEFLIVRDAMVVAYYRGLHAHLAASPRGTRGAMLAVGTSIEDAQPLCDDGHFVGRINVAASNSSSSVTISEDEDAIDALQVILQDENKFNRKLQSVHASGAKARKPAEDNKCVWFSSVYNKPVNAGTDFQLSDRYWAKNVAKPVLFSQALSSALASGTEYDVAIEVRPHPALKGPASQTMQEVLEREIPHTDTLTRATDAVASLATGLGFLWTRIGRTRLTWLFKLRTRKDAPHPLLGDVSPDSALHSLEWRNPLRPSELPRLDGHRVQSQIVSPAAGYASTAFEAAKSLSDGKLIRLIELTNLNIRQAVAFSDEESGAEAIIRLTRIEHVSSDHIKTEFTYSADLGSKELTLAATGDLDILLGEPSPSVLPERATIPPHTIAVETERFYRSPADLDYISADVSNRYRACAESADSRRASSKWRIARVRVNPALCGQRHSDEHSPVGAWLPPTADGQGFTGECTVYSNHSPSAAIRVEGVTLPPLGSFTAANDRSVFSKMHWFPGAPDMGEASADTAVTEEDRQDLRMLERMSTYYLREFDKQVPADAPARRERPNSCYLNYAKHMTNLVARGGNLWVEKEWQRDTVADIYKATDPYEDLIPDVKMMHLVRQQLLILSNRLIVYH
ncbi:hypothetical protein DL770_008338 [Monosporascus sp. CRB-9-2]|nr:hypothetical protein DL770_008338 [Monosporascus sp. CRB-9-2]